MVGFQKFLECIKVTQLVCNLIHAARQSESTLGISFEYILTDKNRLCASAFCGLLTLVTICI